MCIDKYFIYYKLIDAMRQSDDAMMQSDDAMLYISTKNIIFMEKYLNTESSC